MIDLWEYRNLPGEVIGITPDINDLFNDGDFEFLDQIERGHEIDYWLKRNDIDNYVIIDDVNEFLPHQMDKFVKTSMNLSHKDSISPFYYGLTRECMEKAINILKD